MSHRQYNYNATGQPSPGDCRRPGAGRRPAARPRAFTIFELLAVITLLTVLLTLLLPTLSDARESARKAVCASNLRQINIAFGLYTVDHKGDYPDGLIESIVGQFLLKEFHTGQPPERDKHDLRVKMKPYVDDPQMFYCPSGAARVVEPDGGLTRGPDDPYGWNSWVDNAAWTGQFSYSIYASEGWLDYLPLMQWFAPQQQIERQRDINVPSAEVMAQDMAWTDNAANSPGFLNHPEPSNEHAGIVGRQTGFHNLYYDGSVKFRRIEDAEEMCAYGSSVNMIWFR